MLPGGWTIDHSVIVKAEDIRRSSDDTPSEVVAAWVIRDDGQPFRGTPVLWVVSGGTTARYEERPKSVYVLNEASEEIMAFLAEVGASQGRQLRMWPSALAPGVGWTLDHPAVEQALGCLGAR